jgi:hypothetical protein
MEGNKLSDLADKLKEDLPKITIFIGVMVMVVVVSAVLGTTFLGQGVINFGALCFGLVVGWITYRTLLRQEGRTNISYIASVVAAIGGGALTRLFGTATVLFGFYSIGLALGFFSYLVATRIFDKDPDKVLTGTPSGEHDANG